jgi:hypothetical protein
VQHGLQQGFRFGFQSCIELGEALPLGDDVHGIDSLIADQAHDPGPRAGSERVPLIVQFGDPFAAR